MVLRTHRFVVFCVLASLVLAGCRSPVAITPNAYSESLPPHVIEADIAHCDEISDEVQAEYGPHVEIGDDVFAAASENFAIHNRYKSACLRAKGYVVSRHDPVDLPASAVEKARASHGNVAAAGSAE